MAKLLHFCQQYMRVPEEFFALLPKLALTFIFVYLSHSNESVVLSSYGFDLHFTNN
jgi:hypothetical protein